VAAGQGILVSLVGSIISVAMVWSYHYFFTKNIYSVFERASAEQEKGEDSIQKPNFSSEWSLENLTVSRFLYNKSMLLAGRTEGLLGPSFKAREDESALLVESHAAFLNEPAILDPILGEPMNVGHRKGGKYQLEFDGKSTGDARILEQESTSLTNIKSLIFFLSMVLIITFSTAIGAYVTFTMSGDLARSVFIMVAVSVPLDFFVFRNICVLVIAGILRLMAGCTGAWRYLSMGGQMMNEIHGMMKEVVDYDSDDDDEAIREHYGIPDEGESSEDFNASQRSKNHESTLDEGMTQRSLMKTDGFMTKGGDVMRTKSEMKVTTRAGDYDKTMKDKEHKFKPSILNELCELNLLLHEKIYRTFENKGDKVFFNFRRKKFAFLRPKLVSWKGEVDIDMGPGPDNASEETLLIDGAVDNDNIFWMRQVPGHRVEDAEADYRRL